MCEDDGKLKQDYDRVVTVLADPVVVCRRAEGLGDGPRNPSAVTPDPSAESEPAMLNNQRPWIRDVTLQVGQSDAARHPTSALLARREMLHSHTPSGPRRTLGSLFLPEGTWHYELSDTTIPCVGPGISPRPYGRSAHAARAVTQRLRWPSEGCNDEWSSPALMDT
jgi:hypothetical protein